MKRNTEHRRSNKKIAAMLSVLTVLALAVIGYSVSGTVAWLASKSESTVSTFTIGDINITLTESSADSQPVKIIPGIDIGKDPKVTVESNSEACWLFVKAEETNWPDFTDANGTARKVSPEIYTVNNNHFPHFSLFSALLYKFEFVLFVTIAKIDFSARKHLIIYGVSDIVINVSRLSRAKHSLLRIRYIWIHP